MKLLFLTDFVIYPPRAGAQLRIYGMLAHLCKKHEVVLFAPTRLPGDEDGIAHLESIGIKVETVKKSVRRSLLRAVGVRARAFFSRIPSYWVLTNDDAIRKGIAAAIEMHKPDIIVVEYLGSCRFCDVFPNDIPLVLDEYDVVSEREMAVSKSMDRSPVAMYRIFEARKVLPFEKWMFQRADLVIACSDIDRATFEEMSPGARVTVIPNGVELSHYQVAAPVDNKEVIFTGSLDCGPNIEAAMELAVNILPRITQAVPDVKGKIVGRRPGQAVRDLAGGNLEVVADVPDIRPYIENAAVIVVPVKSGSGTRLKILEAMAAGKAIVSTSKGAEGIAVTDGSDIVLRNDPQSFADAVVELLNSSDKRIELGANARKTVEDKYGCSALSQKLEQELAVLLESKKSAGK